MGDEDYGKVPAWDTAIQQAARVEFVKLRQRCIIPEQGWPDSFWSAVQVRKSFDGEAAQQIIQLFQSLTPGESARCHIPPWGLAFYDSTQLLFTTTLCFECSNAYLYTDLGKELRAFNTSETHAQQLLSLLNRELPL